MYAIRRVKDAFREHKALNDPSEIKRNLKEAHTFLEIIKRQVINFVIQTTTGTILFWLFYLFKPNNLLFVS